MPAYCNALRIATPNSPTHVRRPNSHINTSTEARACKGLIARIALTSSSLRDDGRPPLRRFTPITVLLR